MNPNHMYFNRPQMKQVAKQRIRMDGVPSIRTVTFVFLCLTTLLDSLLYLFYGGASSTVTTESYEAMLEGNSDALYSIMSSFFGSTAGMISIFFSIFMTLYCLVVSIGYYRYTMKIARNQTDAGYHDLSYGLEFITKIILLTVLQYVFILLWSMLFVIPGIIAAYRYRMAYFALIDDPDISVFEALNRSKAMMQGYKWELFLFDLSFYGWTILASVLSTIGSDLGYFFGSFSGSELIANVIAVLLSFVMYLIVGLWLTAYEQISEIYFYDFVKNEAIRAGRMSGSDYGGYGM